MGREKSLYDHLVKKQRERKQPSAFNFCEAYLTIKKHLEDRVYDNEELGAALCGDGVLTNHGKKHVDDVIRHIERLLHHDFSKLNLLETFVLLLATLLHDVGNVSGRAEHEKKIASIINQCDAYKRLDTTVKVTTIGVAQAHGGRTKDGDKDTLSQVQRDMGLGGEVVRTRSIAALLRFADELADNAERANDDMERLGRIPEMNLIYHKYSRSLQPVIMEGVSLKFHYSMTVDLVLSKFKKEEHGKVCEKYLYDEILDRLRKASCEMAYCVRHSGGIFHYDDIIVTIDICSNEESSIVKTIPMRFRTTGYPNFESDICEERESLEDLLTGEKLATELKKSYSAH